MNKSVTGILKYALSKEKEGQKFYSSKLNDLKNEITKEIFSYLSEMENGHMDYISNLLDYYSEEKSTDNFDIHMDEFFDIREITDITGSKISDITDELPIVRMAYLIEDDFVKFYELTAEKTDDEKIKNILLKLSEWEKNHRNILLNLYDEMKKQYWNEMGFEPLF
ncbi:MAG TPA: ferritin family protein [Tepiditoga sp.]|nr:ferritin family protein [Thermotogota bacterium]HOO73843.1 ferritin family protein [Tepiditoga sp.]